LLKKRLSHTGLSDWRCFSRAKRLHKRRNRVS
jgi:hypothetical protein